MANIRGLSLAILLVSVVLASSLLHGAFAQAGYGGVSKSGYGDFVSPLQAALVHCNAAVENQNCCKALSTAVHNERYCWASLFGQIFIADLFKCGVIPKC